MIIIDEVHNLIGTILKVKSYSKIIYDFLINASNLKLVLLSGTPVKNNSFEFLNILNLLNGYEKSKNYEIITTQERILKNKLRKFELNKVIKNNNNFRLFGNNN